MPPAWLPLAALAFIVAASAARVWAVERAYNVKAFGFGKRAAIQSLAERHWKMAVAIAFGVAALSWLAPEWEAHLGGVEFAERGLKWIATGLFAFSALLIVVAQLKWARRGV